MRRQPQKLTAVKTQSDAMRCESTRLFQNAKYERVQKFNIHLRHSEGCVAGEQRAVEGQRCFQFSFAARKTCHKLLRFGLGVTVPVTVTVTATVTAIRARTEKTTTTILTQNLLIPMNCGPSPLECCASTGFESPRTCILQHVQNKRRRHLLNRQGIRLQLRPATAWRALE